MLSGEWSEKPVYSFSIFWKKVILQLLESIFFQRYNDMFSSYLSLKH